MTVILGPMRQLVRSSEINRDDKRLLMVMERNVNRMLRLVNRLLDFNKLENGNLKLSVRNTGIVSLLKVMRESFAINAHEKRQAFLTCGLEDSLTVPVLCEEPCGASSRLSDGQGYRRRPGGRPAYGCRRPLSENAGKLS